MLYFTNTRSRYRKSVTSLRIERGTRWLKLHVSAVDSFQDISSSIVKPRRRRAKTMTTTTKPNKLKGDDDLKDDSGRIMSDDRGNAQLLNSFFNSISTEENAACIPEPTAQFTSTQGRQG